jgi:hypothetical protein
LTTCGAEPCANLSREPEGRIHRRPAIETMTGRDGFLRAARYFAVKFGLRFST